MVIEIIRGRVSLNTVGGNAGPKASDVLAPKESGRFGVLFEFLDPTLGGEGDLVLVGERARLNDHSESVRENETASERALIMNEDCLLNEPRGPFLQSIDNLLDALIVQVSNPAPKVTFGLSRHFERANVAPVEFFNVQRCEDVIRHTAVLPAGDYQHNL